MTASRRLAALTAAVLLAGGCGPTPPGTPSPAASGAAGTPAPSAVPSDAPFRPVAWPAGGSACLGPGHAGLIGRVAAPDAHTVVFSLCQPDGAFLQRLAHPAMGIVDAVDLGRIAADPTAMRDVAGQGAYRIVRWGADNAQLARIGDATAQAMAPTVILRWAADDAARSAALVAASVDGIDTPSVAALDAAAMDPSLAAVPRAGLATAVLGFGGGAAFGDAKVRRALAGALDRDALAAAFPPGSVAADHLVPCGVPSGCSGSAFPAFNGPAAVAALQAAKFDFGATYTLSVPDAAIAGLPDPAAAAAAVRDQLAASAGITLQVVTLPADQFRAAVDDGSLAGLYLDGVAATVGDPSEFLGPLLVDHPASLAARRAPGVGGSLAVAARSADPRVRDAAFAAAAKAAATNAPVVPLVHPGGMALFRADVRGAAASPLGTDPLGAMTAADRGQVVFLQAGAPAGGWCGAQWGLDAYRLCALVTDGLYGHAGVSLDPVPALASACTPSSDATLWTCRLRAASTPGARAIDAADVVATFRAMGDPTDPAHLALGDGAFSAWTAVFGLAAGAIPQPSSTPGPAPAGPSASTLPSTGP